jgi:hypothetical protein
MDEADNQAAGTSAPVTTDNASDQPSETSQSASEAPEATPVVEEKQTTEVKAEDKAEEQLIAGKFKTQEDLEKGYKELESKFGKEASEKAELTRILNEAFATPEAPATDTASDTYEETTPQVNQEFEQMKRDNAVIKFIVGHQDADGETMKKILAEDPLVKQISGHDAKLEYAYLRSQNMSQPKAIAEAKKTAQVETQAKTAEKQAAQVESAKKAEPVEEDSDYEKATGNYDQNTRDAARLRLIRKNLVNL